jgi:hypothetical protein
MHTVSSAPSAAPRQKATIVREYGPLPVNRVHGLTHDGTHVWFAHGKKALSSRRSRFPPRPAPPSTASTCIKSAKTRFGRWTRRPAALSPRSQCRA